MNLAVDSVRRCNCLVILSRGVSVRSPAAHDHGPLTAAWVPRELLHLLASEHAKVKVRGGQQVVKLAF